MTDHQQAAIEAAMKKLLPRFLGQSRTRCEDSVIQALAAAEPHLRRKWAEEIREKVNPPDVDYSHEWRRGFTVGAIKAARFVEGAGNEPIHGDYRRPIPR